jgi:hypothetical protein
MAIYLKAWGIINFWEIIRFIQSATIACCLRFLSMKEMFAVNSIIMITYAKYACHQKYFPIVCYVETIDFS